MMNLAYRYKQRGGTWIIVINIYGSITEIPPSDRQAIAIEPTIHLMIAASSVKLIPSEIDWITYGVQLIRKQLLDLQRSITINIEDIEFEEAFYQEEALACAMIEWLSHNLSLVPPRIDVAFDKRLKRYVYHFP